ncbi:hypothetical protein J9345_11555 [Bacillus subtilis subsp. subtilis]|uniref:hypothetical protein n=1 Tax=Bacillus halotolerans TaxID=260554 RepID=UPI00192B93A9|nr:hypothetical protein [Bacillus halotolerans]MBL4968970.1 hypothetical protein [Bacillus halotolerans]MBL4973033.1 hypothetical protein [Bacillus halotolerans]MBL4978803.1 hypothetical protein [Bacillus halotolerans]MBP3047300.1 hypothetical protein [Bacillus subtilis subsp. subtilis]
MQNQLFITPDFKNNESVFNPSCFTVVENYMEKPEGGFWTSSFNEEFGSEWLSSQFIIEDFNLKGYLFKVDDQAKVLDIDNLEKAFQVLDEFCIGTVFKSPVGFDGKEVSCSTYKIDFEKIALSFDAVSVSGDACNLHLQYKGKYSPFASWSLESTVWFNLEHLTLIKELSHSELMNFRKEMRFKE